MTDGGIEKIPVGECKNSHLHWQGSASSLPCFSFWPFIAKTWAEKLVFFAVKVSLIRP